MRPLRLRSQLGASLMELMVAVAIGSITMVVITRFILKARGNMSQVEAVNEMDSTARRMDANLATTLRTARLLVIDYSGDRDPGPLHSAMVAAITASGSPAPVTFSAAPVSQDISKLDFGVSSAPNWGNELYFVGTLPPVTLTVNVSPCASASVAATLLTTTSANLAVQSINVSVDRAQFVAIYLAQDSTHILKGGQSSLRMVQWRSKPFVVRDSLIDLSNSCASDCIACALLTGTCKALNTLGYNTSLDWNGLLTTTASVGGGYFSVSGNGSISANVVIPSLGRSSWSYLDEFEINNDYKITTVDDGRVATARTGTGFAGGAKYSMAYNTVTWTATPTSPGLSVYHLYGRGERTGSMNVPYYAQADRGGTGFPGGFEVAVFGRAGSRELYMRLVQMVSANLAIKQAPRDYLGFESIQYALVQNLY